MTPVGHAARTGALALLALLAALAVTPAVRAQAPGGADPGRRAVVAFVAGETLASVARDPGVSAGLLNPNQGRYRRTQMLLDVSQGARTSRSAYSPSAEPLLFVRRDGRVAGWDAAVARARAAPAGVTPGLLASSVGPAGAAYVAPAGADRLAGIVAADTSGRIAAVDVVAPGAVVARTLAQARRHRLVVATLPDRAALRDLLARRSERTLVIAITDPPPADARVLAIGVAGLGGGRALTSRTTRTDGLVAAIDVAPTVTWWLDGGDDMTGRPIELDGPLDVAALTELRERLEVVRGRRYPTLGMLGAGWAILAAGAVALRRREGWRWALRTGGLAVLWILPLLLAFAVGSPSATLEEAGVAACALALGAATGALVRWPLAPAVPGAIALVAYTVDLAAGSPLIVRSILGPNPLAGSRFFGIGNELESTLPVLGLATVAALACATGTARRSGRLAAAFALAGLAMGVVLGWGRLGADVGGVITVGAGAGLATVLALPGRLTARRVAAVVAVPALAVGALALVDLATGGDGHFTRTVLRGGGGESLGDVVQRRYELAWNNLRAGVMPLLAALSVALIAWGVWRRDRLLARLPGADAWGAALAGGAAAGLVGALSNDSGPILLVFATFATGWLAAYLHGGRPHPAEPVDPLRS
ncbi:MAG: hypothetical protein IRZ32_12875 [Solirubrobacteraceae bacterium]|nr:hypothetical protein [Solirubrobacteraceae bacterium]